MTTRMQMADKKDLVMAAIAAHVAQYRQAPTYRELAEACGFRSLSNTYRVVRLLIGERRLVQTTGGQFAINKNPPQRVKKRQLSPKERLAHAD